ncbi:hypothetical protein OBBRIDRAFT_802274 [Obba rivulosa]|uniref:Uncharacterized protein n=1 Tax=Obba rivulosa TaxID=1052685 RepID=A0A8E2DN02_9APHY|nr:hypothetical protein OBBRIDRAFT_802274 [Obba rivulosa]
MALPIYTPRTPVHDSHYTTYTEKSYGRAYDAVHPVQSPAGTVRGKMLKTAIFHNMAQELRTLSLIFDDARPSREDLQEVSDALAVMSNLEELTIMGLPSPDLDGWILRRCSFALRRFCSNLSLSSKDVQSFLGRQSDIIELGSTSSLRSSRGNSPNMAPYDPLPLKLLPNLTHLDCPAPVLLSILLASPPMRPITHLRADFTGVKSLEESEALACLSLFNTTIENLSIRRAVGGNHISPASGSVVGLSTADFVERFAERRRWTSLKFLEFLDGPFDATVVSGMQQAISTHFPNLHTLIWAPSGGVPGDGRRQTMAPTDIAATFMMFCPSLSTLILLEGAGDDDECKHVSYTRSRGQFAKVVRHEPGEIEGLWRHKW